MSNRRKGSPLRTVLIWTIVLAVLAAAAMGGSWYIGNNRDKILSDMQQQVIDRNNQRTEEYYRELAEFEREHNQDGANDAWPMPSGSGWEIVDLTNYPLEEPTTLSLSRQDTLYNGMLLVNQWHARPADFSESGLVSVKRGSNNTVSAANNNVRLFADAVVALSSMIADAKVQAGLDYYNAYTAYRSNEEQQELVDAKRTSVAAGCSDYNAGQSVQITLYHKDDKAINDYSNHIFESEHGKWLLENCWKYGFVFRFPLSDYPVKGTLDKSYKTGIDVKMQTFRYVGLGNAAAMRTLDLCLEEYVEYLSVHPHIAVFENGTLRYEIVRQYVGEADTFQITATGKRSVRGTVTSLDNMGYAVTVFSY